MQLLDTGVNVEYFAQRHNHKVLPGIAFCMLTMKLPRAILIVMVYPGNVIPISQDECITKYSHIWRFTKGPAIFLFFMVH